MYLGKPSKKKKFKKCYIGGGGLAVQNVTLIIIIIIIIDVTGSNKCYIFLNFLFEVFPYYHFKTLLIPFN